MTTKSSRLLGPALLFLALLCFGVLPAGVVLWTAGPGADPTPLLEAEARGRAAQLDATIEGWEYQAGDRGRELAGLLGQLPPGPLGKAAAATVLLHLQRRLSESRDLAALSVLDRGGRLLLSTTDGPGKASSGLPELAQAARRPATTLVRGAGAPRLVVAAPIPIAGQLGGLFVAHLQPRRLEAILAPTAAGLSLFLVDANGLALPREVDPELARLGSESRAGQSQVGGRPAVFVPLQRARAVLVALGVPSPEGRPYGGYLAGLGVLLVLAGLAAFLLSRQLRR